MPQINDLLVTTCRQSDYHASCTCRTRGEKHIGVVREINLDSYGHQQHVLIEWSTDQPIHYREDLGYNGTNIHNLRSEFTVIRDGEIIL